MELNLSHSSFRAVRLPEAAEKPKMGVRQEKGPFWPTRFGAGGREGGCHPRSVRASRRATPAVAKPDCQNYRGRLTVDIASGSMTGGGFASGGTENTLTTERL